MFKFVLKHLFLDSIKLLFLSTMTRKSKNIAVSMALWPRSFGFTRALLHVGSLSTHCECAANDSSN